MRSAYLDKKRNLYVIGAQSSGKTTLIRGLRERLKQHTDVVDDPSYEPAILEEVARGVLGKRDLSGTAILASEDLTIDVQTQIMEAQYNEETETSTGIWYIADRSAIDALMYAQLGAGPRAVERLMKSKEWTELFSRLKSALIVICEPVQEWVKADGLRHIPESFEKLVAFHSMFLHFMDEQKLSYVVLPRSMQDSEERVDFVMGHWD